MAVDFLKKPLEQGDRIVFIQNGYREFSVGTISRVLPKKVEVSFKNRYGRSDSTFRFPEDVVRV